MSSTTSLLFCSWWVLLCFHDIAREHLIISLHASLDERIHRCFPSSPVSLPSDQRPSLCSSHGLSQVLSCHPLVYTIVLQAHWGHPAGAPPPSADLLGLAASVTVCDCDLWVTHSGYISVQVIYIMYGKTVRETERTLTVLFNRQCSLLNGKEGIYFFADDGRCYVLCTAQVA